MIREEYLLKILHSPFSSEKVSSTIRKTNTFVLKVDKRATKKEIKIAVQNLCKVKVKVVNTLVVKGKVKRHSQHIGHCKSWKKAYVTLKEGQSLEFVSDNA